jgi:hypothetical protein
MAGMYGVSLAALGIMSQNLMNVGKDASGLFKNCSKFMIALSLFGAFSNA